MAANHFDAIVIGLGGMGSATAFELARRGARVLGLEQFAPAHDRGSSHGHTRIIRTAYYEHPGYVPLVKRSYHRWYDLEQRIGCKLLTECGCLTIGTPDSEVVQGVRRSAAEHGLAIEVLDAGGLRRRFPPFRFSDEYGGVLEADAGFLYVEDCVRAQIDSAIRLGAALCFNEKVQSWNADPAGVQVATGKGQYRADRLIVTAGPWAGQLLQKWARKLTVMRQTPHWFQTSNQERFRRDRFPIYIAEVPEGFYYGFPVIDSFGHKVARHYGSEELATADAIKRETTPDDEHPIREFLGEHLPEANGRLLRAQTCIYTLTPDRHFILDRHPDHENVAVAAGFSGHGFKFAPVVGEILADLSLKGQTDQTIDMFRLRRFAD